MFQLVNKLDFILEYREKKRALYLVILALFMALIDTVGVASIAPFMIIISDPQIISENHILLNVYRFLNFEIDGNQLLQINDFLFFLGLLVFATLAFSTLFKAYTIFRLDKFSQNCNTSISKALVSCYVNQPYSWFLNRHSSDVGKAVLSEVNAVVTGILFPAMLLISYAAICGFIFILLIIVDPWLAFVVGVGLSLIYLITFFLLRKFLGTIGEDRVLANAERYKIVQEGFAGIKNIKFLGLENNLVTRFDGPSQRYAKHTANQHIVAKLPRFFMELSSFGGILALVLYLMVTHENFQEIVPILALYSVSAYKIMPALQQVYAQLTTIKFSMPALDLLHTDFKNLKEHLPKNRHNRVKAVLKLAKKLTINNVSFQYDEQAKPALKEINLSIPAFSSVAFVGSTGSGKTTLMDIILGLLDPKSGHLEIDDECVTSANKRNWQNNIGYVPQNIYLSDASISENIAFGVDPKEINHSAIIRAAKTANLHKFVNEELSDGYSTVVGEQGVRLSGGQRQRIGIARALYYDPDVLIFDEATSALDNVTERSVMNAVNKLSSKKTILMVAHRLSTVKHCDKIILLEGGEIIGEGTYNTLTQNNSRFQKFIHER